MSSRTRSYNGWNSLLAGTLASGNTTVPVDSAAGLVAPLYLVVDWDDPAKIEWIRVNTVVTNTLSNITRNLSGSVGDVTHDVGAKIRAVMTKQALDDIFTDIEAIEGSDYKNGTYVDAGDAAAAASGAATAQAYSDGLDHDHATAIAAHAAIAGSHHARYTDGEAVTQADNQIATHASVVNSHHTRYTDTEAANKIALDGLYALTAKGVTNGDTHNHLGGDGGAIAHSSLSGVTSSQHHTKYTDSDVLGAVAAADQWVKNIGDVFTNQLRGPNGSVAAPSFAAGSTDRGMYSTGGYIGLAFGGVAVVVGNALDEVYMSGVSAGTGDDMVITNGGSQIRRVVSSRRYKNVGPVIDKAALREKLMALPVYEWNYKTEPDIMHIGWMAEDVATVDPRLVNFDAEGRPDSLRTLDILAIVG